jgi:ribosomal protein S20
LAGRKALRLPLEKVKGEEWGHIRDPRKHFFSGNKTIWEELYSLRDLIVNPPNDIPYGKAPQINITTEKIEDYNLIHIKGGFHSSSDCINCENSFVNIVLTLDSSVAFNLVHREVTNKAGQILQTLDITYERVGHIYVPKSVNFIAFGSSDQNLIFYSQLTFTKSILNLPIPEEMFNYGNLGLKDEDRFKDEIADKEFIYQNDKLVEVAKKKSEDYRIVENEANGKSRVILEQSDAEVKMKTAMRTFAKAINEKDIETLKELLKNDIWQVRFRSLQVLEAFLKDDKQSLKEAAKSLENDENTSVQEKAKSILSKIDINKPNSEPQK